MLPHADTDTSAMLTSCLTTALRAQNFEHLTQAATGATSGDWLVKFCKSSVSRCSRVESTWAKLSAQLAAARDAKGMPRVNVASVDTTDSGWLTKRFGRSKRPPWQWSSLAPVPPSDAPGSSRCPRSHGEGPVHWVYSHCLRCSSYALKVADSAAS